METLKESFGRRLRNFRKRAGLSAEELAEALKVHPNTVYCLERAEQWISAELLERIATVLKIDFWELFTDTEPMAPTAESLFKIITDQERRIRLVPQDIMASFDEMTPKTWEILRGFIGGLVEGQKQGHQAPEQPSHVVKSKFK